MHKSFAGIGIWWNQESQTHRRPGMVWMCLAKGAAWADLLGVQVTEQCVQSCAFQQCHYSTSEAKCHFVLGYKSWHKGGWDRGDPSWHIWGAQLHQHGSHSSVVALTRYSTILVRDTQEPGTFSAMQAQLYSAVAGLPLLSAGVQVLLAWASLHCAETSCPKLRASLCKVFDKHSTERYLAPRSLLSK